MNILRKRLERQLGDLESPIYERLIMAEAAVDPAFFSPLKKLLSTLDDYLQDAFLPLRGSAFGARGDYILALMHLEGGRLLEGILVLDELREFLEKPSTETRKLEFPSAREIVERLDDLMAQLGGLLKRAASSEATLILEEYFDELYSHRHSMEHEYYVKLREARALSSAAWHGGCTAQLVERFLVATKSIDHFSKEKELVAEWRASLAEAVEDLAIRELWREQTAKETSE